jgi:hypothetical protein|tara:strand:- start:2987 stop:3187 length:201 start_codon:yes stop_codon:yes gene_type:complete
MALSNQITDSLKEAEGNLRNALAFAARSERPFVAKAIATMITDIDNLTHLDQCFDTMEEIMEQRRD